MHPRSLYFTSYHQSIFWLAQRFINTLHSNSFFTNPTNKIDLMQEIVNGYLIKHSDERVDDELKIDITRTRMYVTAPWQKAYYLLGWKPENSQFTQGDWGGGPFFSILPPRGYILLRFPYLNDSNERCGMNIAFAEDDPSDFFISHMENNDRNKKVHVLCSRHHKRPNDFDFGVHHLKSLEETKNDFLLHFNCEALKEDLQNLFIIQNEKVCINVPLINAFKSSPKFEWLTLADAPWLPRPRPSKCDVAVHYAKSIAKSAAVGAAIGLTAGFLLGLATFGIGWIVCIAVGTALGIIDGFDYAKNNPARPSFFSEKKTMPSATPSVDSAPVLTI